MRLNIQFLGEAEGEALVAFLCAHEWPFHLSPRPTPDEVAGWIAGGKFTGPRNETVWLIGPNEEKVGLLAIHELDDVTPTFDIRIGTPWRRKGVGGQALCWLARYLFTHTDRTRVEGHTRADNLPMRGLFRAAGWVQEAHYRQAWPDASGRLIDATAYALLKEDWQSGDTTARPALDDAVCSLGG